MKAYAIRTLNDPALRPNTYNIIDHAKLVLQSFNFSLGLIRLEVCMAD